MSDPAAITTTDPKPILEFTAHQIAVFGSGFAGSYTPSVSVPGMSSLGMSALVDFSVPTAPGTLRISPEPGRGLEVFSDGQWVAMPPSYIHGNLHSAAPVAQAKTQAQEPEPVQRNRKFNLDL